MSVTTELSNMIDKTIREYLRNASKEDIKEITEESSIEYILGWARETIEEYK